MAASSNPELSFKVNIIFWAFSRTRENDLASHPLWQYEWRNFAFIFTIKVALCNFIPSVNGGTGGMLINLLISLLQNREIANMLGKRHKDSVSHPSP